MLGVEALRTGLDFASSPSETVAFGKEESVRFGIEISYRSNEDFLGTEGVSLTTLTLDSGAEVVRWDVGTFFLVLKCWLRRSCTASEEEGKDADFGPRLIL
jgi:hypothetical protein